MKPSTLFIILAFVALAVLFYGIHKEASDLKKLQEEKVYDSSYKLIVYGTIELRDSVCSPYPLSGIVIWSDSSEISLDGVNWYKRYVDTITNISVQNSKDNSIVSKYYLKDPDELQEIDTIIDWYCDSVYTDTIINHTIRMDTLKYYAWIEQQLGIFPDKEHIEIKTKNLLIQYWNEYKSECYADSTLEHTFSDNSKYLSMCYKWVGNLAIGQSLELICENKDHFSYYHKEPTFEGFMEFIERK